MRTLLKLLLGSAVALVVLIVAVAWWFFFYSRDLPDVARLAQFAPASNTSVSDPCLGTSSVAIPYEAMGGNFRNALSAVEVRPALQISRTMFCAATLRTLHRELAEMRISARIERHYSRQELFTIYANRTYFGEGLGGVQSASQYFFHKDPGDLSIAEAALLAGLVKGPSYLSPVRHPERALRRRNEVIDAMSQAGSISVSQADAAKNAPLQVAVNEGSTRRIQ